MRVTDSLVYCHWNVCAYFKNRLRRTRRDSLDAIKQMKLPEDDEKREREIVEKTLVQVCAAHCMLLAGC